MHASSKFLLQLFQLRLHPLAHRLADDRELSSSRLPADVRESEKVECLRLSFSALPPFLRCMSPKLDQSSLFPMQFQFELAQSRAQFALKSLGVCSMLKAHNKVVGVSHDDHCSSRFSLPPLLRPQVEYVVKIDVCKYGTNQSALRRPIFIPLPLALFHDSRSEPFLDQSRHSFVPYPMLDHLYLESEE